MVTANARPGIALLLMTALAACGGGGGGGGTGINPPPPPPPAVRAPQMMAYSAADGVSANGMTELYALADDGTGERLLSAVAANDTAAIKQFEISPNGQWIAYVTNPSTISDILYVVPVDGGTPPVRVSRDRGPINDRVKSFQWSPDSTQLVYAGSLGDGSVFNQFASEVFLVNRDGTGDIRISGAIGDPATVEVRNPQWSPDGRYIVQDVANFSGQQGAANAFAINIYDTTAGSPNSRRLVTANTLVKNVHWSADSARLSYTSDQEMNSTYFGYAIGVDGSGNVRVTDNGEFNSDSRWSPTGARLAYLDHPGQPFPSDLVVSAATPGAPDTVLVFLSPNGREVFDYEWSPNGTQIAYTSNEAIENTRELYVINADGSGVPTKVSGPQAATSDVFEFAWSPDGNSIAYLADQDTNTFIDLYVSSVSGNSNTWISMGLNGEEVVDFGWSDDGQRIAFSTGPEGRTPQPDKLYVVQPNGSGRTEISAPMIAGPLYFEYD